MAVRPLVAASLALLVAGCQAAFREAEARLDEGRAGEALALLEPEPPPAASASVRARYALVRGLALFAVGDVTAASRWLGAVHDAVALDPRVLDARDLARFDAAWAHLDARYDR